MKRPLVQLNLRSSSRRSPVGSRAASLMSKSAMRSHRKGARARAADQEAEDVAVLIEAALRDRDQRAGERLPARHGDQGFEALVVRQRAHTGWHLDRLPARVQAILAEVEAYDPVDALDADIKRVAVLCD